MFESGQHPIIVGQSDYNTAYGTSFAASGDCTNPPFPAKCDGLARINQQGGDLFTFDTLKGATSGTWAKLSIPFQPKALHDEMNAVSFDEFGRMTANIGIEAVPANPAAQNVTLYPFINPATELIDATNLPKLDALGIGMTPISVADDGTQIWKITHNGVDTHPIHFHLYDVQVLNRVTWDNIIIKDDPTELGWKDTVRISPLQDTIVALRPVIPYVPWELPNSIRMLNPMMEPGSQVGFNNVDPQGNPTNPILNQLVNFGWQYVYHCHILSHEEMDMMRPVSVALPPIAPDGLVFDRLTGTLTWNDNSINETEFLVQNSIDGGVTWVDAGTSPSPLDAPNAHSVRTFTDPAYDAFTDYQYRVVANNTVGYGAEFPSMTVKSTSAVVIVLNPPRAPSNLTAALTFGPTVTLSWTDNSTNETGFIIERSTGGAFTQIGTVGAGITTYVDTTGLPATTYTYQVAAVNAIGSSLYSNQVQVVIPAAPAAPSLLTAVLAVGPTVNLTFRDNANNELGFIVERSTDGINFTLLVTLGPRNGTGNVSYGDKYPSVQPGVTYTYRVAAINAIVKSAYSNTASVVVPPLPPAPTLLTATPVRQGANAERVTVTWTNIVGETGYTIQWSAFSNFSVIAGTANVGANVTTFTTGNIARQVWYFRVGSVNQSGTTWSNVLTVPAAP